MSGLQNSRRFDLQQCTAIVAIGAGVGWLTSFSASPVLAGVLASLLGIVAGVVTAFRSIGDQEQAGVTWAAIDARPAAFLILTIALVATAGMFVKSHRLLEPRVVREAAWRSVSQATPEDFSRSDAHGALLFGASQSECNALLSLKDNPEALVGELKHSSMPAGKKLAERITDPGTLVSVVEVLCEQP